MKSPPGDGCERLRSVSRGGAKATWAMKRRSPSMSQWRNELSDPAVYTVEPSGPKSTTSPPSPSGSRARSSPDADVPDERLPLVIGHRCDSAAVVGEVDDPPEVVVAGQPSSELTGRRIKQQEASASGTCEQPTVGTHRNALNRLGMGTGTECPSARSWIVRGGSCRGRSRPDSERRPALPSFSLMPAVGRRVPRDPRRMPTPWSSWWCSPGLGPATWWPPGVDRRRCRRGREPASATAGSARLRRKPLERPSIEQHDRLPGRRRHRHRKRVSVRAEPDCCDSQFSRPVRPGLELPQAALRCRCRTACTWFASSYVATVRPSGLTSK